MCLPALGAAVVLWDGCLLVNLYACNLCLTRGNVYMHTYMCTQPLTYLVLSTLTSPYICKHGMYKEDVYAYTYVYTHTNVQCLPGI